MPQTKRAAAAAAAASRKKINHDTTFDESDESEDEKELDTSKEVPPDSEEEKNDAFVFIPKKKQTSPNTLGRKKKSNDYKDALESVSVIIVDPDEVTGDRATGLVIIPRGFMMDKWMSNPFYLDRTDPIKIDYLDTLGCVPWCMNGAKDKTGELISKTFNEKQYAYKALVILTDGVPAEEDIVKLVNETVAPEIWNSYLRDSYSVRKKRGEEKNLPTMIGQGRDHMWKVSSWSDALWVPEEIFRIGDSMGDGGLSDWLRQDKGHLYQLYTEGSVPIHDFKQKNLPIECLRPLDKRNYLAFKSPY